MAKKRRQAPEINASSMADIAFLLLIFFLVTTEIVEDKGILVKLPIWSDEPPPVLDIAKRNVFTVLVNKDNQLLVRDELLELSNLKERAKEFIANPNNRDDLARTPKNAIISLRNDRGTNYTTYMAVYNELQAAYNELWSELSMKEYGVPYSEDMEIDKKKFIKSTIPFVLSEAEPTSFGDDAK